MEPSRHKTKVKIGGKRVKEEDSGLDFSGKGPLIPAGTVVTKSIEVEKSLLDESLLDRFKTFLTKPKTLNKFHCRLSLEEGG